MSDEEATLIVTGGTAIYAIDTLGGLIAGRALVVIGAGPVGLMCVALAKALGAHPVILLEMRDARLKLGLQLGADRAVNVHPRNPVEAVKRLTGGKGAHYVIECSGSSEVLNQALGMVNRGGKRVPGGISASTHNDRRLAVGQQQYLAPTAFAARAAVELTGRWPS